jgi:hypothetical protein
MRFELSKGEARTLKIIISIVGIGAAALVTYKVTQNNENSGQQQVVTGGDHNVNQNGNGTNVGTNNGTSISTNNGTVTHIDSAQINDNKKNTNITVGDNNSGVNIATDNANVKNSSK